MEGVRRKKVSIVIKIVKNIKIIAHNIQKISLRPKSLTKKVDVQKIELLRPI
jgi:hypothetical protein